MKQKSRMLCMAAAAMFGTFVAPAQDDNPLGEMSGVGGAMREVETRAAVPVEIPEQKEALEKIAPPTAAPLEPGKEEASIDVATLVLTGDTAFAAKHKIKGTQKTLETCLRDIFEGKKITVRQTGEELTALYEKLTKEGYYLARLSLPSGAYNAQTKTLTINVEVGFFGAVKVKFDGDKEEGRWFSRKQIERQFKGLGTGKDFNYLQLYRKLSEVNAHPDLTLDTHITVRKPLEGEGEERRVVTYADLEFTAKEKFPLHAMLEVNNYGTDSINEWQSQLTIQYLNLTKADDVLTFSPGISLNGDLVSAAGSYMRPHHLGKGGATTVYGGFSHLSTDDVIPRLDLTGKNWFVGIMQSHRLIDSESRLLSASAGIVYRYVEDQFSVFNTSLQQRDVTVLPLTVSLSYTDRTADFLGGRNFATLSGVYNLSAGGNNDLEDMWVGAKNHYAIARLQYARLQPLFARRDNRGNPVNQWTLFLKAEGQLTSDPLIPSEKLFVGGFNTVRGYTNKGYLGDNGVYGTIELRTPILLDLFASRFRAPKAVPLDRLQFLAFIDAAHLRAVDPLPGAVEDETLVGAGFGLRLALTKYSQFRFDCGFPLHDASGDDDGVSFYVSGQIQF